ncbi:MAG: FMN reductase [Propionibacteriales bacterium]|nr:FMN reductase [Propionibacteriales bacterium]
MSERRLVVVTAGLSQPSTTRLLADRLGDATRRALDQRGDTTVVETIELRQYAHDITDHLLTGFPSIKLRTAIDAVVSSDGLVAVTPIFTASFSGLFKSFIDVLEAEMLVAKPVLVAATGGTERHSLTLDHALRPVFGYLRAVVVPTGVFAASGDWGNADSGDRLNARIERAAGELAALMSSPGAQLLPARSPADAFDDPTPFEQLLRRR